MRPWIGEKMKSLLVTFLIESLLHWLLTRLGGSNFEIFRKIAKKSNFLKFFAPSHKESFIRHRWGSLKMQQNQKSQKSKFFEKSCFLSKFSYFWRFLKNSWLLTLLYNGTKCLASKNTFIIVRVTRSKNDSKKSYSIKFVQKSWIFVDFWNHLSPQPITLYMFCKVQ